MVVSLPVEETKFRGRLRGMSLCCRGCALVVSYGSLGQSAIRVVRASGPGCRRGCVSCARIRPSGLASIEPGSTRAFSPVPAGQGVLPTWISAI